MALVQAQSELAAIPGNLSKALIATLALIDGLLILSASLAFGMMHSSTLFDRSGEAAEYVRVGIVAAVLFYILANGRGIYLHSRLQDYHSQAREVALTWTLASLCVVLIMSTLQVGNILALERAALIYIAGLAGFIVLRRALNIPVLQKLCSWQVVLVVPSEQNLPNKTAQTIEAYGGTVCNIISVPPAAEEPAFSSRMEDVINWARQHPVDEVVVSITRSDNGIVDKIAQHLSVLPLPVRLFPDPVASTLLERPIVVRGPTRAIELQRSPLTAGQLISKRVVDLFLTIPAVLLLVPMLAVIAALIAIDSPGPILFRQRRTGFNGRTFDIYKFRTMRTLDNGTVIEQAARTDARVTRIGRILRQFSIDELPQLINVLKGEMSLVGPRPHAVAHDTTYCALIASYSARQKIKPGITGWAQVNGWRGGTPEVELMVKRVEHDLWYIHHWSLWLDIKILVLTGLRVCNAQNAY
jgi:Undecaprenyl-phosphate glucose phosphotransferase